MPGLIHFSARYFDGECSRPWGVEVSCAPGEQVLILCGEEGEQRVPLAQVRVGDRIGQAPRVIYLGLVGELSCDDQEAADALAARLGQGRAMRAVFRLEQRTSMALLALLLAVLAGWYGLRHAMPWLAAQAAERVPAGIEADLGRQSQAFLDGYVFRPSRLDAARQANLRASLAAACARLGDCPAYRLEFRDGGRLGANALALPGGTLVMTDQLVALAESEGGHPDSELIGVLAHELGHVAGRHSLRRVLASAGALFIGQVLMGDLGSLGDLGSGLPALLLQTSYTRDMESESDAYALRFLQRACLPADSLAGLLTRLEARHGGGKLPALFSSHPLTEERVKALRRKVPVAAGC